MDGRRWAEKPWKASSPTEERAKFVLEKQRDELNMAELCRRYGISRQTGYKWLERYAIGGIEAMTAMPGIEQKRVRAVMEAAFREYGLPKAIRSDNGSPFVTGAPGGLSELSIWWMRLGIRHERIEPGEPQQNGRHERVH